MWVRQVASQTEALKQVVADVTWKERGPRNMFTQTPSVEKDGLHLTGAMSEARPAEQAGRVSQLPGRKAEPQSLASGLFTLKLVCVFSTR